MPDEVRLGLIARADRTGLGIQGHGLWEHLRPERTLVVASVRGYADDLGQYHGDGRAGQCRYVQWNSSGGRLPDEALDWILEDVDVVLGAEALYDDRIYERARARRVATVVVVNPELWRPVHLPTLVVNPSVWLHDRMPPGSPVIPHPVDRCRIPFRRRTEARRFLHVVGHGAIHDRPGTEITLTAWHTVSQALTLTIRSQGIPLDRRRLRQLQGRRNIEVLAREVDRYEDLWADHDVLLAPRRYGGNSLPLGEAMSAGMVVVATDREPERSILPPELLVPVRRSGQVFVRGGMIPTEEADPRAMAAMIRRLSETDLSVLSDEMDARAEARSWTVLRPRWEEALADAVRRLRRR